MRIGIVGSGIAGLGTAVLLRRAGHSVDLLERSAAPRPLGAGLFLQPPGAAILADIGGLSLLSRSASRITRIDSRTTAGAQLIDVDYARVDAGLCAFGLTRPAIWNALFEPAVTAGVTVKAGVEVIAADNRGDQAVLTFRSGQSESYDFVVLASGTHASVLPAGLRRRARLYPWGCLWTTVEIPAGWPDDTLVQRCAGTQVMVGVLPTGRAEGRRVAAIYWSIRNDAVAAWRATPLQSWKDAVRRVWPDAGALVEGLAHEDFQHATYRDVWASPPYVGRVLLVGDAAHGTSPQLGQGATQALRDAEAVSVALAEENLSGREIASRLAAYWEGRRRRVAFYRLASRLLTPVFQSDGAALAFLRDLAAGPIGRIPFIRRQAVLTSIAAKTGILSDDAQGFIERLRAAPFAAELLTDAAEA